MNKIPALRFPEFKDEWREVRLGEICEFFSGGTPSTTKNEYWKGNIPFIKSGEISQEETSQFINKEALKNSSAKLIKKGDLLLALYGATSGEVAISKINGAINQAILCIRSKYLNTYFLYFYFLKEKKKIIKKYTQGGQPNLSAKIIKSLKIKLPPTLEEQQKIADFLSAIDNKIELQTKKIEKLKEYKKGLMQKLLSAELRFPEFTDEWKAIRLGEIVKKAKSGGTPKSTIKEYYNGNIPFLSINDMTTQGKYLTKTSKYISEEGLKNSASWIVPVGSIIYSMYASVGFVSINKIPLATSQAVINLILKDNYNTEYIYYYLLWFKKFIHRYIETGTQGNLNAQIVKNLKIYIPPTLKEQQKIASFLSDIDEKIELNEKKLEKLKEYKKGLLQKMFV